MLLWKLSLPSICPFPSISSRAEAGVHRAHLAQCSTGSLTRMQRLPDNEVRFQVKKLLGLSGVLSKSSFNQRVSIFTKDSSFRIWVRVKYVSDGGSKCFYRSNTGSPGCGVYVSEEPHFSLIRPRVYKCSKMYTKSVLTDSDTLLSKTPATTLRLTAAVAGWKWIQLHFFDHLGLTVKTSQRCQKHAWHLVQKKPPQKKPSQAASRS